MKKFAFIMGTLVLGCSLYWVFIKPTEQDPKEIKDGSSVKTPKTGDLPPHLQQTQSESRAKEALPPKELAAVKENAKQMQQELTKLTLELDKNLENPAERKKIEEKYAAMTVEYNKLVLQIVKSESQPSEVAPK